MRINQSSTCGRSEIKVVDDFNREQKRETSVYSRCTKRADASLTPTMYLVEPDTCGYVLGVSLKF